MINPIFRKLTFTIPPMPNSWFSYPRDVRIQTESLKKETFSFIIQGHVCCTEGELDAIDRKTNERNLSIARAKFVYDYLLSQGIKKSRMSYEGLAHKFPLGGSEDKDRRVEILILSD